MTDGFGRSIDYLRISVTDRCDLRCVYCMPEEGVCPLSHGDLLRYEDILRLVRIFASLGISKVRLTGGEPLVRKNLPALMRGISKIEGVETLALTTNGMLLEPLLPALTSAGLTAVNISLDAISEEVFARITRRSGVDNVLRAIDAAAAQPGLRVKLNCVPTELNRDELAPLARYAISRGIPLRFIELMPIGEGARLCGLSEEEVLDILSAGVGAATPLIKDGVPEKCRRYELGGGRIGFISSVSHRFCESCDRIRLTADGKLKTCLQYGADLDIRAMLGRSDDEIREALRLAIAAKPAGHHFGKAAAPNDERRGMYGIGG